MLIKIYFKMRETFQIKVFRNSIFKFLMKSGKNLGRVHR